jgi:hypothetical protein
MVLHAFHVENKMQADVAIDGSMIGFVNSIY